MKDLISRDLIKVSLDPNIASLSDSDKERLLADTGTTFAGERKGLSVTFELSRSGKIINGRVYNPWAQRDAKDWTYPYEKAITTDHVIDEVDRVIGRIKEVQFVSLEQEAVAYLGSYDAYNEVNEAFESKDHEKIHTVVNKYKLYDKKWPGLAKLVARARITDPKAIDKFIDQRYLTFSGAAATDKMCCSKCGEKVKYLGGCKHSLGFDDKGEFTFVVTGVYKGKEVSVVGNPANDTSVVLNMVFDSDETPEDLSDLTLEEAEVVDSVIENTLPVIALTEDRVKELIELALKDLKTASPLPATVSLPVVDSDVIPWGALDAWLTSISPLKDGIQEDSFISATKQFAVYDNESYEAAKKIIDTYSSKLDDSLRDELLRAIEARKPISVEKTVVEVKDESLIEDYKNALLTIEDHKSKLQETEEKLHKALNALAQINKKVFFDEKNLDEKLVWLDTLDSIEKIEIQDVSDPISYVSSTSVSNKKTPTEFQKIAINRYKQELSKSQQSADKYLQSLKHSGRLAKDFNIEEYI